MTWSGDQKEEERAICVLFQHSQWKTITWWGVSDFTGFPKFSLNGVNLEKLPFLYDSYVPYPQNGIIIYTFIELLWGLNEKVYTRQPASFFAQWILPTKKWKKGREEGKGEGKKKEEGWGRKRREVQRRKYGWGKEISVECLDEPRQYQRESKSISPACGFLTREWEKAIRSFHNFKPGWPEERTDMRRPRRLVL